MKSAAKARPMSAKKTPKFTKQVIMSQSTESPQKRLIPEIAKLPKKSKAACKAHSPVTRRIAKFPT
jgi:hypothetical protein